MLPAEMDTQPGKFSSHSQRKKVHFRYKKRTITPGKPIDEATFASRF